MTRRSVMADEKKDNPDNEKGDKGHERER